MTLRAALMFGCLMALMSAPAFAQRQQVIAPTPEDKLPALPSAQSGKATAAPAVEAGGYFPALPPSRPCAEKDLLDKLWILQRVFEAPIAAESADFKENPFQYYIFGVDKIYRFDKDAVAASDAAVKRKLVFQQDTDLQQFQLTDAGMLFFYKNSQLIDTKACFIVVTRKDPFYEGQMLLMPPQGTIAGRLVKTYQGRAVGEIGPLGAQDKKAKKAKQQGEQVDKTFSADAKKAAKKKRKQERKRQLRQLKNQRQP